MIIDKNIILDRIDNKPILLMRFITKRKRNNLSLYFAMVIKDLKIGELGILWQKKLLKPEIALLNSIFLIMEVQ